MWGKKINEWSQPGLGPTCWDLYPPCQQSSAVGAVKSPIHILLRDSQIQIKPQYSNPKPCMIAAVKDATSWGLAMFGYAGVVIVPGAMHLDRYAFRQFN